MVGRYPHTGLRTQQRRPQGLQNAARFILQALPYFTSNNHRFGIGATLHLNPIYDEKVDGIKAEIEFDNAFGFVVDYGYSWNNQVSYLGVRYTAIDYEIDSVEFNGAKFPFSDELDGSNIEFYATFAFN